MTKYFYLAAMTLLLALLGLSGCSGVPKMMDNVKADFSENQGDEAYQKKDYPAAFNLYQKAADEGGSYGQFMLATMYKNGEAVKRDQKMYLHWLRKSAANDYPRANYFMGIETLPGDAAAASVYFENAAKKEHALSMHMLGLMYARGNGVPQNDTEALRWFRMANAQGFPVDQQLLSESSIQAYMKKIKKTPKKTTPKVVKQPQATISEQPRQTPPPPPQPQVKSAETPHATIGDKKALIREIQQCLTEQGYKPGPIDGIMGGKTLKAIQDFQRKRGMEPDGLATEKVLDALKKSKP
jgi:hypothetical protein